MSKELSPSEAFDKVLDIICKQKADNNLQSYIDIVETALENYSVYEDYVKACNLSKEDILTAFALLSQMRSMGIGTPQVVNQLKNFEELKKGIEWRMAEYIKELDSGVDCDGTPLSETNRKIVLNLYNIMCALKSYYREKN